MVDERTRELIHAELDGELDPTAQAELETRLAAGDDARRLRDDLQRIAGSLARMSSEEPPLAVRAAVRQAVRESPISQPASRRSRHIPWAMAAGIAVAAVGLLLIREQAPPLDPQDLVGTMAKPSVDAAYFGKLPSLAVATAQLRGTVALQPTASAWILNFELDSTAPVTVSAQFDTFRLGYLGFVHGDAGEAAVVSAPGRVTFINSGTHRLALFFAPDSGGRIRVKFESQGRVLHEGTLEVPGPIPAGSP